MKIGGKKSMTKQLRHIKSSHSIAYCRVFVWPSFKDHVKFLHKIHHHQNNTSKSRFSFLNCCCCSSRALVVPPASQMRAVVTEDDPVEVTKDNGESAEIRVFSLVLNSLHVQVSSFGASILRVLVPSRFGGKDDVVLGFRSLQDMIDTKNPPYFNAVVGRVANRIKGGYLQVDEGGDVIRLDCNDNGNHLHGGYVGFDKQVWDASLVSDEGKDYVQFQFISSDGDQHYPGSVLVKATYSLQPTTSCRFGARLCLCLEATLLDAHATPINMAQHSYFNLHRHDTPRGCLDHILQVYARSYTAVDKNLIITREVPNLDDDPVMDWRRPRQIQQALVDYAVSKADVSEEESKRIASCSRIAPDLIVCGPSSSAPGAPVGFDHNYVVERANPHGEGLPLVAVLEHEASGRRLTVRSDAPGVQVYTANFLDGSSLSRDVCKDSAVYGQWQGICLETQYFPDSVLVNPSLHSDFAKGSCPVLRPSQPTHTQSLEYEFEYDAVPTDTILCSAGSDSDGELFPSREDMWESQGISCNHPSKSSRSNWYARAATYYEDNCETTLDGVLGGFASISDLDLKGSRAFVSALEQLHGPSFRWSLGAACECGAGIGRVTKGLLLSLGVTGCDLVESSSRLISAAPEYIGDDASACRFYCSGLQDWEPQPNKYSIVWIQWVLCYLTDDDVVAFLSRCASSLIPGGYVVIKENTCLEEGFVLDAQDASVTRSVPYLRQLLERTGLRCVFQMWELNLPSDVFPVPMLALQLNHCH